jgi:hypothetical protein
MNLKHRDEILLLCIILLEEVEPRKASMVGLKPEGGTPRIGLVRPASSVRGTGRSGREVLAGSAR